MGSIYSSSSEPQVGEQTQKIVRKLQRLQSEAIEDAQRQARMLYQYDSEKKRQFELNRCEKHTCVHPDWIDKCLNAFETIDRDELLEVLKRKRERNLLSEVEDYFYVGDRLPHRLTSPPDWTKPYTFIDELYCRNLMTFQISIQDAPNQQCSIELQPLKRGGAPPRFTLRETRDKIDSKDWTLFLNQLKWNHTVTVTGADTSVIQIHPYSAHNPLKIAPLFSELQHFLFPHIQPQPKEKDSYYEPIPDTTMKTRASFRPLEEN